MSFFYTNVAIYGNTILYRGYNDERKRFDNRVKYKPYLFVQNPNNAGTYETIDGKKVEKLSFPSIREAKNFIEKYDDIANYTIYGYPKFVYPYIYDHFPDYVDYNVDTIRVGYIDIECTPEGDNKGFPDVTIARDPVTAITLRKDDTIITLGLKEYTPKEKNVTYFQCRDEVELLHKFLKIWKTMDLDVISGWNINFFDIPYMVNRIRNILGEDFAKALSPWGMLREKSAEYHGKTQQTYELVGISTLDYLEVYKKFIKKPRESYSLDFIAYTELDEKKLDYSEFKTLKELYEENPEKFFDYNIHDTNLVYRLEQKLKLIELVFIMAYIAKVNYTDALSSVLIWEVIIHNFLMHNKKVMPPRKRNESMAFAGAYVKEPQAALHEWVVSFDVTSMYPHLIMQYSISPETLITNDMITKRIEQLKKSIVDHIVPISKGGKHHPNNLQYLTLAENRKKGNKIDV